MPIAGQPKSGSKRNVRKVFLNCPWDEQYKPLMDAMILATLACGFQPVSMKESGPTAPRLKRIWKMLSKCDYSIHDLSRSAGRGEAGNARANMPLELGMAIARMHSQRGAHDWLVLVADGAHYTEYLSDLGGYDPVAHDETPRSVAREVMRWLRGKPSAQPIVTIDTLLGVLPAFTDKRTQQDTIWGDTPWYDLVPLATALLKAPPELQPGRVSG